MVNPGTKADADRSGTGGPDRLSVVEVSHSFGGVRALRGVDFELQSGRIHGLVGQNGAGKSTLIQIMVGALKPMEGHLRLDGRAVVISSPAEARALGIAAVHQDIQLFPELDVATNVYAIDHDLPRSSPFRAIDWAAVRQRTATFLSELGIELNPRRKVESLAVAERKLVQIARAVALRPSFLILDEPTASLERRAARAVLELLVRLRSSGLAICFVSHRLDEVRSVSDEIFVLRDGRLAGRVGRGAGEGQLIELMLGRAAADPVPREEPAAPLSPLSPLLEVRDLAVGPTASAVSFEVRSGEIMGLTGLMGSGAEQVVRMLAGGEPCQGWVSVEGRHVRIRKPTDALAAGIAFIPEDRKSEGVVEGLSVAENISMASLADVSRLGFLDRSRLRERARSYAASLGIKTASVQSPVSSLSGGNQQKVLAARCLATGARILALHEPTHGVDVGAIAQIQQLLREFAARGGAVLVASGEVRQLLEICDRIAVFRDGEIIRMLSPRSHQTTDVMLASVRDAEDLIDRLMSERASAGGAARAC